MASSERETPVALLTAQERRVALGVGSGKSNKAVARDLVISIKTVEFHLGNVYRKLGLASRAELANLVGGQSADVFDVDGEPLDVGYLPQPPRRLVGRAVEVELIKSLVVANPLVTLMGVGGVGKTALALTVANQLVNEFEDGVWWVDLASVGKDREVAGVVASALQVRVSLDRNSISSLRAALASARLLIVLDNCEHVLASAAALSTGLLASCPDVAVLATSRHRLAVPEERTVIVRTLDVTGPDSPALALLVDRIDRLGLPSRPSEMTALQEICRHLDGLPLALELAAGRCRTMSAVDVAVRLGDRFRLLGGREGSDRSTLLGTLHWSYDLLGDDARIVLARISAFAGMFTLRGAEQVAGFDELDNERIDDAMSELVELSLVEFRDDCYRLLETTRAFAQEVLEKRGEAELTLARHLAWVVDFVGEARRGLRRADELEWVEQLDRTWPDVRAVFHRALDCGDPSSAIALATNLALEGFYRRPEACAWIVQAHHRFGQLDHPHRHELVGAAAFATWVLGQPERALELGREAMALDPSPGTAFDRMPELATTIALGFTGNVAEGIELAYRTLGTLDDDPFLRAFWLATIPLGYSMAGDLHSGREESARAVRMAHAVNNPSLIAYASIGASFEYFETEPERTVELLAIGRSLAESVGNSWLKYSLTDIGLLASIATLSLDPADGLHMSIELVRMWSRHGWALHALNGLSTVSRFLLELGRYEDAAVVLHAFSNSVAATSDPLNSGYVRDQLEDKLGPDEMARISAKARELDVLSLVQRGEGFGFSSTKP
jgi:predicted ATPase/DNA-binding CsgD family transcriptional regulator